jgi:hypothetical protein
MNEPLTKVDLDNAIEEINETAAKKILELERIDKVVQAAVLAEREACAQLLNDWGKVNWNIWDCIKAIRARGNT